MTLSDLNKLRDNLASKYIKDLDPPYRDHAYEDFSEGFDSIAPLLLDAVEALENICEPGFVPDQGPTVYIFSEDLLFARETLSLIEEALK